MRCANCALELGESYTRCPFCGAELAATRSTASHHVELVSVATSSDLTFLAVAKSLLGAAQIPFLERKVSGGIALVVPASVAEDARLLLAPPESADVPNDDEWHT
jgi:hypothetical protein